MIWTFVTCADLRAAGASVEETEGIVDVIRGSREHEVAVVLKQDPGAGPGSRWKASVRSRGQLDVGAACSVLGGGGHRLAAGLQRGGHAGADHRPVALGPVRHPVTGGVKAPRRAACRRPCHRRQAGGAHLS